MKKQFFFVALVLLLATGCTFAASTVTRLTVDLDGQVIVNENSDNPTKLDPSFSVGADLVFTKTPTAELGLGAEYQKERTWSTTSNRKVQFIPIYGFINYHGTSNLRRGTQPYFTGRFGYSIFNGPNTGENNITSEGGLYYSLGFGINFQDQFRVEAGYSSCSGLEKGYPINTTRRYEYNRTSVTFGIAF